MASAVDLQSVESERSQPYVIFQLGGEAYALEVMRVQEVIDQGTLTQVPGASQALKGVINLRGHVVPVYDLRIPFGLSVETTAGRAPCVLIVESRSAAETRVTGMLVVYPRRCAASSAARAREGLAVRSRGDYPSRHVPSCPRSGPRLHSPSRAMNGRGIRRGAS
jgi:CheW-like protein